MNRSRREGVTTCYIKKSLSYKSSFCPNIGSISRSKLILIGVLYRPPVKPGFIEHPDNSLKASNIFNIQECYLMGDFNIILLK